MDAVKTYRGVGNRLMWLSVAVLLICSTAGGANVEVTFPVLKTRTATYTNVTVTTKTETYVMLMHAGGLASVKIPDLSPEAQQKLGYAAPLPEVKSKNISTWAKQTASNVSLPDFQQKFQQLGQNWREFSPGAEFSKIASNPTLLFITLGIALLFYLFYSYCLLLICRKANYEPGVLIWVPVLQLLPLIYAARMPTVWFLAFLVPVLNLVAQIVWAINISKARGKSPWTALWLLLPVTSLFAFLYLAFSRPAPEEVKEEKPAPPSRELMDLQVA